MVSKELKEELIKDYGEILFKEIEEGYKDRFLTLRVNNLKTTKDYVLEELNKYGFVYENVDWYDKALIIKNKSLEEIKKLEIYQKGEIYLQSLSSMLPPLFLDLKENDEVLDMAAAPGGKTTQMQALANNKLMITAIEKNKIRAERLKYNIEKLGAKKVNVMNVDARYLDEYFQFSKILLDAPCSGSGTLNYDAALKFDYNLVKEVNKKQIELLKEAVKHLKINGILVYSTCSILKKENEEVIKLILEENKDISLVPIDMSKYKDIPLLPNGIDGVMTVLPNFKYEGFFVAVLTKK